MTPVTNAITPLTVFGLASLASNVVNRSRPPERSALVTSMATPQTITIADQGIALNASASSAHRNAMITADAAKAARPSDAERATTARIQIEITSKVIHWDRDNGSGCVADSLMRAGTRRTIHA